MSTFALTALSPLDGRYYDKVNELRPIFSEFGLIRYRVEVEVRWLQHLAQQPLIKEVPELSSAAQEILNKMVEQFSEQDATRVKQIEYSTNHDVKAVEYFIKEKISSYKELDQVKEFFHFACTSADINNLAYGLMLQNARKIVVLPQLDHLIQTLRGMAHAYADKAMLSRTHGQPATPTTMGKEIANYVFRLQRQREQLAITPILGKFNGAVGNYNAHLSAYPELDWERINKTFVESLNLYWNPYTTQIEPHDTIAEYTQTLTRMNTILIDLCRDMWGYISLNYFTQKLIDGEVGSSTMPHKINPIDFENAEGNCGIANAINEHFALKLPASRFQRDLTNSTVLRNLGTSVGYQIIAFKALVKGLNKLELNHTLLQKELEQHWELLAEPIQTVMRRYGINQPYEKLKNFTRGKKVDQTSIKTFIEQLELPKEAKRELYKLTPMTYLGNAAKLARSV